MQENKTNTTSKATSPVPAANPLQQMLDQKIEQLVTYQGVYCVGAVEDWSYDGKSGVAGFIQILQHARDDSAALTLVRIKVEEDQFGLIDILNKTKSFQFVQLTCVVSEDFNKKMKVVLSSKQQHLAVS